MTTPVIRRFDIPAFFAALDAQRIERGLSWRGVADQLWDQSAELNRRRRDHPISPATISGIAKRGETSCQHALFMLRWLDRSPESFLAGNGDGERADAALPVAGPDRRLRWDLAATYAALDMKRRERELTWPQAAKEIRCSPNQLTGLRTARYAMGMTVAMRIVQWLDRPAADFVYAAEW